MKKSLFLLIVLCLTGCAQKLPKVDGSTPETYKSSIDQVTASVPKEIEEKFNFAMGILSMESLKEYIEDGVIMMDDELESQAKQQFQQSLHGLNYKQILARVDQVMKAKMERAREQYEEELLNALDELIALRNAEPTLAKIITSEHQISDKIISMQIENGTKHSLTELWFLGLVAPKEDQLPSTRFATIDFDKPLVPGEKRTVTIPLEEKNGWTSTDYLAVPRITLVIVRAEDTKKKVIIHEKFAEAFDTYVALSKSYDELLGLLEGKEDWVNTFTTENIVKGFFPLK